MSVHAADGSDAATRRNEGLGLINEIYGTGPDGAKRRNRLELIFKLDILKDIGADPPITLRAPRTNELFVRAIRQLTAYDPIPNHPMVLEVQKQNIIDESNVEQIPICFLQTLLPWEYKHHLSKGRHPVDPRGYLVYQDKLPHVNKGFHESGYSPDATCGKVIEEILTAASYFDPAGRKKFGEPSVSVDTNLAYSIGGNPGAVNPYYNVLSLMGFGSALKTFSVGPIQQNGSLAVDLAGAAGKGFLDTHSEINRDFNCIGGDDISISNPVKNRYLIDNAGNLADATVHRAAKYLLYKALGDAMQVILARLVIGRRDPTTYCLFTVDSVVAAKCIELQIPVCRQCSTSEYSKEKADLGQSFYYTPSLPPELRSILEFDMLRTDIYHSNEKVLRQIRDLLTLISTGGQSVKMGATIVDVTDISAPLRGLFEGLYSAITAVNTNLPTYRALFSNNVRDIECLRANMVCEVDPTNAITIFRTNSLFHVTYRDHHVRIGLPPDPIYGNELTAIVLALQQDPAKRGKIQRGGQHGGAWVPGENVPRNFMKEYYELIIHIVGRIYGELGQSQPGAALQAQLLAMYNEDTANAEFVFDIAYHFIISTAAYFNYIGFSCTDEETLYEIVRRFMTGPTPGSINLSFEEFARFFNSLRKPQILLENNRDIAQATREYNASEAAKELLGLQRLNEPQTPPRPTRVHLKAQDSGTGIRATQQRAQGTLKKRLASMAAAIATKRGVVPVGQENIVTHGGSRRRRYRSNPLGNSSYRSKRATVKAVRTPRLKTRKMRRRAVSHIRE